MYFVDMRKMNETLEYFDQTLALVKENKFQSSIEYLALERITHLLIENILDVGNMMIDGFIMRDPGSYLDIVHILIDENVIPENENRAYEAIIGLRKTLVQHYRQIDHKQLQSILNENINTLTNFSTHIRTYLATEMGVANTFTNNE
ncbi:Uncharacterized conserved protein YutE, UPF0331/DUF86 family [Gracilibacillus orientalis]|uniref:Uncharacterized conserved protein YutE, UPF0331/DUF86 family n=1 Tax=Gracilibacillus orientalis TaxID=334253 RepID=A0A1I4QES5_9BACI|nr:DUF86 domain-containing protein [Gracilibacillus orientalis]SFM38601.1 Uncharacterized conserved protein YutE, UPF0331/DUF86 family [Gracilibacillus orientalis]